MQKYLEYELLIGDDFIRVMEDLVSSARHRVYVASYVASMHKSLEPIYYAMSQKARSGVDVVVFLNGKSSEALKYNEMTADFLRRIGIRRVKLSKVFTHIKLYIVDDYFIIGSHNLTGSSKEGRIEISVMIHSREMSDILSGVFKSLIVEERIRPFTYRGLLYGRYPYEIMTNYRVLRHIYLSTKYAERRAKIIMYIATLSRVTRRYYLLLVSKQREGVDVAVILNGASRLARRYNEPVADYLRRIGVKRVMLSRDFVHAKLVVVDDSAIIGSHNMTSASVAGRLELSVEIENKHLSDALDFFFEHIWRRNRPTSET